MLDPISVLSVFASAILYTVYHPWHLLVLFTTPCASPYLCQACEYISFWSRNRGGNRDEDLTAYRR